MVEPAGIEPASATFNCRDSFTSLADFDFSKHISKICPLLKGASEPYLMQLSVYRLLPPHTSTGF